MKKVLVTIVLCLAMVLAVACGDPATSPTPSAIPSLSPSPSTTPSPSPSVSPSPSPGPDPEPVIDTAELYQKVFVNQSVQYTVAEAPDYDELDSTKDEVSLALYYYGNQPEDAELLDKVWVVEGVSTDFADGMLDKYVISPCYYMNLGPSIEVSGYYHSAYLDVLFENVTFETVEEVTAGAIKMVALTDRNSAPNRVYVAYDDMKLYYEEEGLLYRSEQSVDVAYLHMMGAVYVNKSIVNGGVLFNEEILEGGTPEQVTVELSNGERVDFSIYPSGKVYGENQNEWYANAESGDMMFVYQGILNRYYSSRDAFMIDYGDDIVTE